MAHNLKVVLSDTRSRSAGRISGKCVLVVGAGPTLTHGEMKHGAGTIAAERLGTKGIVDPRPFATGTLIDTFNTYQHIGNFVPAITTLTEMQSIIGTPIDLNRVITINKPTAKDRN
ncbi:hypothetical protein [Lentibacillus cibarius]|uniref:Uncharacterized protein n=1 Tax=Lentibacillus cibarius TaxID=2583219 RepID=A0A5S3R7U7_9BACI|nr:hypothetical protein [Lentibacillus cibarius]TMN22673.1 hypothetical protein FFL34_11640 [Lentibacillus cibarius]